jgi:hypothetical protein
LTVWQRERAKVASPSRISVPAARKKSNTNNSETIKTVLLVLQLIQLLYELLSHFGPVFVRYLETLIEWLHHWIYFS